MDVAHFVAIFSLGTFCACHSSLKIQSYVGIDAFVALGDLDPSAMRRVRAVPQPETNGPLKKHQFNVSLPANISGYEFYPNETNHIYYNVSYYGNNTNAKDFYVHLKDHNVSTATCADHEGLSKSHLKAASITLPFEFPFYGLKLTNLTLATGGFLYSGNPDHNWIAATQYIAPLMADFSFGADNESGIHFCNSSNAITFEWRNALLHEKPQAGPFTFQVTLRADGTIIFSYSKVPVPISSLPNDTHPVKIGVSDAYMIDRQRFIIRYRTIYEYHRISLLNNGDNSIVSGSALVLTPLPTCIAMESCAACIATKIASGGCLWCHKLNRCSDGIDRYHQDWHANGCPLSATNDSCPAFPVAFFPLTSRTTPHSVSKTSKSPGKAVGPSAPPKKANSSLPMSDYSTGGGRSPQLSSSSPDPNSILGSKSKYTMLQNNQTFNDIQNRPLGSDSYVSAQNIAQTPANYGIAIAAVMSVVIIGSVLAWVVYAYMKPHSPSGQWLIKYRPNTWRLTREDEIQIANTAF
ncbi:Plexin domain-containing protein 2 [Hypsibius exemplaris]|uniref:Plexin domain-containing protein 2 n=1 Tax=Hypsibius exemplaris TaxID=2072580 RepID=A0A1W0WNT7_HYPEX|nr:Plexin domain-containing protein 2 [Hypsibius exemplaris]